MELQPHGETNKVQSLQTSSRLSKLPRSFGELTVRNLITSGEFTLILNILNIFFMEFIYWWFPKSWGPSSHPFIDGGSIAHLEESLFCEDTPCGAGETHADFSITSRANRDFLRNLNQCNMRILDNSYILLFLYIDHAEWAELEFLMVDKHICHV